MFFSRGCPAGFANEARGFAWPTGSAGAKRSSVPVWRITPEVNVCNQKTETTFLAATDGVSAQWMPWLWMTTDAGALCAAANACVRWRVRRQPTLTSAAIASSFREKCRSAGSHQALARVTRACTAHWPCIAAHRRSLAGHLQRQTLQDLNQRKPQCITAMQLNVSPADAGCADTWRLVACGWSAAWWRWAFTHMAAGRQLPEACKGRRPNGCPSSSTTTA